MYKFINFMIGRNGLDSLNKYLLYIYFVLLIVNLFVVSLVIDIIKISIFLLFVFRFCSKNLKARDRENMFVKKIIDKFKNLFKKNKSKKDNIYKKCKCGKVLRLPLPAKRGIKHVKCPTCKKRLRVICFRKQKVDFIGKENK